jgi:hypothetical protein
VESNTLEQSIVDLLTIDESRKLPIIDKPTYPQQVRDMHTRYFELNNRHMSKVQSSNMTIRENAKSVDE